LARHLPRPHRYGFSSSVKFLSSLFSSGTNTSMPGVYGHLMTAVTEGKHNHLYLGSATDFNNGVLVHRRDQHIRGINGNCKIKLKHYSLLRQKDVKRTSSWIVLMNVPIDIEEATKQDLWAVRLLSFVGEAVYTAWLSGFEKGAQDGPALKGAAPYKEVSWYGGYTHSALTDRVQPIGKVVKRRSGRLKRQKKPPLVWSGGGNRQVQSATPRANVGRHFTSYGASERTNGTGVLSLRRDQKDLIPASAAKCLHKSRASIGTNGADVLFEKKETTTTMAARPVNPSLRSASG
jgi:hypothetical protein